TGLAETSGVGLHARRMDRRPGTGRRIDHPFRNYHIIIYYGAELSTPARRSDRSSLDGGPACFASMPAERIAIAMGPLDAAFCNWALQEWPALACQTCFARRRTAAGAKTRR